MLSLSKDISHHFPTLYIDENSGVPAVLYFPSVKVHVRVNTGTDGRCVTERRGALYVVTGLFTLLCIVVTTSTLSPT